MAATAKSNLRMSGKILLMDELAWSAKEDLEKKFNAQLVAKGSKDEKLTKEEYVGHKPKYTIAFETIAPEKRCKFGEYWEHARRYFYPDFRKEKALREKFSSLNVSGDQVVDPKELNKYFSDSEMNPQVQAVIKDMAAKHKKETGKDKLTLEEFIDLWRQVLRADVKAQREKYMSAAVTKINNGVKK